MQLLIPFGLLFLYYIAFLAVSLAVRCQMEDYYSRSRSSSFQSRTDENSPETWN